MPRERCSGETDLTLTVRVRDAVTAEERTTEIEVMNVPYEGHGTSTPATYFDPPEFDGEILPDIDAKALFDLIEEQDDGELLNDGMVLISTPEEIFEMVSEQIAEIEGDWEHDDGYDG